MDDNLENAAQEFERDLNNAAENAWKPVEESAEQAETHIEEINEAAQEQVAEAAETVEGGWSEVKDDFHQASAETWSEAKDDLQQASAETWSTPETPQTPIPPQPEADRWGAPVVEAADDPGRWNDNLYTPGVEEPTPAAAPQTEEAPKVVDYVATPPSQPVKKDKFPVWAIVLIVLLVLCLCILCPVLILGGAFWGLFKDVSVFLPTLFL